MCFEWHKVLLHGLGYRVALDPWACFFFQKCFACIHKTHYNLWLLVILVMILGIYLTLGPIKKCLCDVKCMVHLFVLINVGKDFKHAFQPCFCLQYIWCTSNGAYTMSLFGILLFQMLSDILRVRNLCIVVVIYVW